MKYSISLIYLFIVSGLFFSCRTDFDTQLVDLSQIRYSNDTIYFDTVFTTLPTATQKLKVYNDQEEWVHFDEVFLARRANSFYNLNINGVPAKEYQNVEVLNKDSLFVFINLNADASQISEPLYKDSIGFKSGNEIEYVKLISLVEDAYFYNQPDNNTAYEITSDTTWSNNKSHLIYGNVKVMPNVTLTIEEGALIYFNQESRLTIDENATLNVNGTLANKVIFRGNRHEEDYDIEPGLWKGILLNPNAIASFNHTIIKNAITSIQAQQNVNLTLNNTELYNQSYYGILGINNTTTAKNVVINNAGVASVALAAGGDHNFNHCTITNHWNLGGTYAQRMAFYYSDSYFDENGTEITGNFNSIEVGNSILYTQGNNSIVFDLTNENQNVLFENNLVNMPVSHSIDFENNPKFNTNFLDLQPNFIAPFYESNNLRLNTESEATSKGIATYTNNNAVDLRGVNRPNPSDLGAYQFDASIIEEDE